ncbi:FAD:protein FMN transferase [Sphaerisporangium melleum]|uniref:FAD:protein FMN transferase n=1 Tax=Sphaerisporangium melleum TaxID=321316 RepID=A0A917VEF3_9ACTN|nr:FAD:protein FMN transferase [Sphaerisporangium melleum]GGK68965.1 FAD:protein FMN transferase [Sphaerisporangium melleum]GII68957.1 FAD:protein FMN transferase [Sphaerisporangium melleum]
MRHVEHAMGTVFSFDIRDFDAQHTGDRNLGTTAGDPATRSACDGTENATVEAAVAEAVAWLHWVDATFSTYRPDSPVSRLGRGEIGLADCPPEVAEILGRCAEAAEATRGYFTAYPGGRLDPAGMVKGWAIDRASDILIRAGAVNHCVNGGGDVQLSGTAGPGRPWRVGVAHPSRPGALAAVVESPYRHAGGRFAVATSGTAERGPHILDPHTGRPASALASITLTGPSLTMTDAYATAAFAMGDAAMDWVTGPAGVEAFAVTASGGTWRTPGFPLAEPAELAAGTPRPRA